MSVMRLIVQLSLYITIAACTPAFIEQNGKQLSAQARLTDSVDIRRGNQLLLSRQSQLCLLSDSTGTDAGLTVLRTMQAALGGYFVAVGVENEPMDYLRALGSGVCPGANYLFYVQPLVQADCKGNTETCSGASYSKFIITVINGGDHSLFDRINVSIKGGFLSPDRNNQQRLQQSFEQLAIQLTGAG